VRGNCSPIDRGDLPVCATDLPTATELGITTTAAVHEVVSLELEIHDEPFSTRCVRPE
jgi:hypothetical protein